MRYLTQLHDKRCDILQKEFWRVKKASTPKSAAIVHLSRMFNKGIKPKPPVWIVVAEDTKKNKHKSGMPIHVYEIELNWKAKKEITQ